MDLYKLKPRDAQIVVDGVATPFQYDAVFALDAKQSDVYTEIAGPAVEVRHYACTRPAVCSAH